jgi:hypothetical protein
MDTFQEFAQQATNDGYQAFNIPNDEYLDRGIATPEETAPQVLFLIERALTSTGAKKVFIVAHSRGGIFVRQTLREYEALASRVAGYLTISTPHHGVDGTELLGLEKCRDDFLGTGKYWQCVGAAASLTTGPMREFNYGIACKQKRWDLAELFDTTANYASQLDSGGSPPQALRDEFASFEFGVHALAPDAHVEMRRPGYQWLIVSGAKYYVLSGGCLGGTCHTVYSLTPINEASDETSTHPNFAEDWDYWVNYEAQWKNGEATVPSYSVSSPKWCVDVGTTTATFPWRADKVPFPDSANLDKEWCIHHEDSNSAPEIYVYALDRLASTVQPSSAQAAASSQVEPEPLAQPLLSVSGVLAPGATQAFTVPLEAVLTATFQVFASPQVSVTLLTPNNELVDPSTPFTNPQITYTVQPGDEYSFYQYRVDAPADGVWQVQLQASEVVTYGLGASIVSPVSLVAERGESIYRPGETIHLYAASVNDHVLQAGFTVTGTAALVDGATFALDFYDDGTHGDITANNGIHTAQLTAPAATASLAVTVWGEKGNLLRKTDLQVPVVAQSAAILQVENEMQLDTNDNGFFDELAIDVSIEIATAGKYDLYGTLTGSSGQRLDDAVYSSAEHGVFASGVQTVTLRFDGKTLRAAGVDGPYILDDLRFDYYAPNESYAFTVDSRSQVYTTTAYLAQHFEGEALTLVAASDRATDLTGDGLYDSLVISATFDVLVPGDYDWSGLLVSADGAGSTARRLPPSFSPANCCAGSASMAPTR